MTDKEAKVFYNSAAWKLKRMQILERDHYECQDCRKRLKDAVAADIALRGEERKIRRAEEVHHIQELKEHPELGLEDDNLISLYMPILANQIMHDYLEMKKIPSKRAEFITKRMDRSARKEEAYHGTGNNCNHS